MITSLYTYILNIHIHWILKDIKISRRITLVDLTHIMNMVDHVAISMGTPWIDRGHSLEKEL